MLIIFTKVLKPSETTPETFIGRAEIQIHISRSPVVWSQPIDLPNEAAPVEDWRLLACLVFALWSRCEIILIKIPKIYLTKKRNKGLKVLLLHYKAFSHCGPRPTQGQVFLLQVQDVRRSIQLSYWILFQNQH